MKTSTSKIRTAIKLNGANDFLTRPQKQITLAIGLSLFTVAGFAETKCEKIFAKAPDAYTKASELKVADEAQMLTGKGTPGVQISFGTNRPIMRAWEKEGLFYEEIAEWFPALSPAAREKLKDRFESENPKSGKGGDRKILTEWLEGVKLDEAKVENKPLAWGWTGARKRLEYILNEDNPFLAIDPNYVQKLIDAKILDFNDFKPGPGTPPKVIVGDDLGSYEVRCSTAIACREEFIRSRAEVEKYLEGKVGHQHLFHGWPKNAAERAKIAPYYFELLDATTWYLFWRQMNRNPNEVESILTHPFLGVYTKDSLLRLKSMMEQNRTEKFNDKYRMVGARSFKSREAVEDPADQFLTDWELRSGNKGEKRQFVETMVEARLVTGDYSGLRDFTSYEFDPSAPLTKILDGVLKPEEIQVIEAFQELHPAMKFSTSKLAKNHVRNRIISPLLPWANRLNLDYMKTQYEAAQRAYARALLGVAQTYRAAERSARGDREKIAEARDEAIEKLEKAIFKFSQAVRLDLALENYLRLKPKQLPSISVESPGAFDANKWPLGIEYSFRFASNLVPRSKKQAEQLIGNFARIYAQLMEFGSPELKTAPATNAAAASHGHGIAVKYGVKDKAGDSWRFEWDGIQRSYLDGKVEEAWGGHAEVVTPKFVPAEAVDQVAPLYRVASDVGMHASRSAGGAHVNFDLNLIMATLPAQKGARAVLNMISFFESNQELILFMWQHPKRVHAAYPVPLVDGFAEKLAKFKGGWTELGRFLYENRYFNPHVGRKPKYVPMNFTALMTDVVPREYVDNTLDIRNPEQEWFPNFANVKGRAEARFFDAPTDEYMAALQIKYMRAFLAKTANSETPIALAKRFSSKDIEGWKKDPQSWIKDATAHLKELGLDPAEFMPLLWESIRGRLQHEVRPQDYEIFKNFKPAELKANKKAS